MKRILIANRGEIACRIIKTVQEMSHRAIAVYSDVDAQARHVRLSDEAFHLGASPAQQSYLNADKILEICRKHHIDAVHPGYGFLSENTDFAAALEKAGIVFIGPNAKAIRQMGDKISSRNIAAENGVPVIPAWTESTSATSVEDYIAQAQKIGFPLLLKAAAGGGGRGIRLIEKKEDLEQNIKSVMNEAQKYFNDSRIFLEKYIQSPRHIEIQILADKHGNIIHLGERECSIQRRYQKMIEETPSPFLDEQMRQEMAASAIKLAKAIGYDSAGTVEFIVDQDRHFYLLEMNTRLQVEHPITEMVTGVDIVEHMISSAFGQKLSIKQKDVLFQGHAIEARIIAEDPTENFMPVTGILKELSLPDEKGIRIDNGFDVGDRISVFYDSLICKIISYAQTRQDAILKLRDYLGISDFKGLKTNMSFISSILIDKNFQNGAYSTDFITSFIDQEKTTLKPSTLRSIAYHFFKKNPDSQGILISLPNNGQIFEITQEEAMGCHSDDKIKIACDRFSLEIKGRQISGKFYPIHLKSLLNIIPMEKLTKTHHQIIAPMPGLIVEILVEEGQEIVKGQNILAMEAMKMENIICSYSSGKVQKILFKAGDTVNKGDILVNFS